MSSAPVRPSPASRRRKRSYSPEDIADSVAALQAVGGNLRRAAALTGVPLTTLSDWARRESRVDQVDAAADPSARRKHDVQRELRQWTRVRDHSIRRVLETVKTASYRDAAWTAGVAQDKVHVLRGGATSRVDVSVTLADFYRSALPATVVEVTAKADAVGLPTSAGVGPAPRTAPRTAKALPTRSSGSKTPPRELAAGENLSQDATRGINQVSVQGSVSPDPTE